MKFKFGNTCFLPVLIGIVIFAVVGPPLVLLAITLFDPHDAIPSVPTLVATATAAPIPKAVREPVLVDKR